MKFSILASGSTGNAIYVGTDRYSLLIDTGITGKQAEAALQEIGVNPQSLNAILVTHEHVDHIKGLGVMARRYKIPIYANEKTWAEMDGQIGKIAEQQRQLFQTGETKELGDLTVQSFGISHDAVEPMGFCVYHGNKKLSIATDLGYVSDKIKETIRGADAYIFEANHDVEMLRMSQYPWSIKRRILSDVGHLSNEASAEALGDFLKGEAERVFLAHLSKENNMMELAKLTVSNILQEKGLKIGNDVHLRETYPHRPTKLEVL
ncbi:MBL fold metallo-hydrolase [Brevibacillus fulvus]|uniref:Phosphoribosyl 1,2-cyclic phosphodiesterase n=1 Tax=Brevibacillus fulvus TaxID=1125967 RepID=A0A938Y0Q8_9BACL|nr:MBL fold metallo-hydrolase [Brevibacillus fulvus]MBM7591789.1 phosphoribosyl 1,2-cyclic phosphodiesterase [Brevibacillus fulvus]